jgi:hypothetical protein
MGQAIVATVMDGRRTAIEQALRRMASESRIQLAQSLTEFVAAAGECPQSDLWSLGWTTASAAQRRRRE